MTDSPPSLHADGDFEFERLVWAPAMSRRARRRERKRAQRRRRIRHGAAALGALVLIGGALIATRSLMGSGSGPETRIGGRSVVRDRTTTPSGASSTNLERPSTTSTTAPAPRTVRMMFSGDIIPHAPLVARAKRDAAKAGDGRRFDFTAMLARVAPIITQADIAICHLETAVSPDDTKVSGYPTFTAPRELPEAIAGAGYDGCSVASNHAMDAGASGVGRTLDALDAAGLRHAGTARSAEERAAPTVYEANGARVAHLSYAYGLNGFKVPPDRPWLVNLIDPAQITADAKAARAAGADIVVVSLHCCVEYRHEPAPMQADLARVLLGSGDVDLVVGHHAHVVQPLARIDGRVVAYGLGNFLTNQSPACCPPDTQDGVILDVTFARDATTGRYGISTLDTHPTWVDHAAGWVVVPVEETLADPSTPPALRSQLETSLIGTRRQLAALGVETDSGAAGT